MENASKALIMAASILIGVMIITIAAVTFNIFSKYSADAQAEIQEVADREFNDRFLRYVSYLSDSMTEEELNQKRVLLTAHDVVTIANYAKENNASFGFYDSRNGYTDADRKSNTTFYIQIDVMDKDENNTQRNYINFENESYSLSTYTNFINNNSVILQKEKDAYGNEVIKDARTKYYVCNIDDVIISTTTKRIKYMKIKSIDN